MDKIDKFVHLLKSRGGETWSETRDIIIFLNSIGQALGFNNYLTIRFTHK